MLRTTVTFLTGALLTLSLAGPRVGATSSAAKLVSDDKAGIERLHQQDVAATLTGNPSDLIELWAADAIRFRPGSAPDVGRAAIHSADERWAARSGGGHMVSYVPEIKDLQVKDGWAFEWSYFTAKIQTAPGEITTFRGNVLRILEKQSDGSWKFARVAISLAD